MDFNYVFFPDHLTCKCTLHKKMRHFCDIGLHNCNFLLDYNDLTQLSYVEATFWMEMNFLNCVKTWSFKKHDYNKNHLDKWCSQAVLMDLSFELQCFSCSQCSLETGKTALSWAEINKNFENWHLWLNIFHRRKFNETQFCFFLSKCDWHIFMI